MPDRKRIVTLSKVEEARPAYADVADLAPGERMEMVWQLTVDAWAFKGEDIAERRFPRDVVRLVRRGR